MKRVLFAHQSTIPHYRVDFYNALKQLRPDSWSFDVVFDHTELEKRRFFKEHLNKKDFNFFILDTKTYLVDFLGKSIAYQSFWTKANDYDLIIFSSSLNNISYHLCRFNNNGKRKLAYWGHGQDRKVVDPSIFRKFIERYRTRLAQKADGFFAYTPGVKEYLISRSVSKSKIFTVFNTIDILAQRLAYDRLRPQRDDFRNSMDLQNKRILLFVGRFTQHKNINFLLESISWLNETNRGYHLILVGSGGGKYNLEHEDNITYLGPIVDTRKLGSLYIASDLFVIPGAIGLGPLQAQCYDLPVIGIDSSTHGPEVEYLMPENSFMLDSDTTPRAYANYIDELFDRNNYLEKFRKQIWSTINHLTIENMARNFIHGINSILEI